MEQRLYFTFLSMSFVLLACSLGIALFVDIQREKLDVELRITETAEVIASLDGVKTMLETGYPDAETIRTLDVIVRAMERIDTVLVCDKNNLRFYQTDRLSVGDTYIDGDEHAILSGSAPYITTVYNTRGMQRCAFHGVSNETGSFSRGSINENFPAVFVSDFFYQMKAGSVSLSLSGHALIKDAVTQFFGNTSSGIFTGDHGQFRQSIDTKVNLFDFAAGINQFFNRIFDKVSNDSHIFIRMHEQRIFRKTAFR